MAGLSIQRGRIVSSGSRHPRTHQLPVVICRRGRRKENEKKKEEMTPSLECREPLVIVLPGRLLSWKSSAGCSKDGGLSQLSAGATIPRAATAYVLISEMHLSASSWPQMQMPPLSLTRYIL